SFGWLKGPSITVRLAPENLTRAPFELGWSPSAACSTPAFTSSSLYFPISVRSFSSGSTPASELLLALTRIMNRIVEPPLGFEFGARLHRSAEHPDSADISNEGEQNRHAGGACSAAALPAAPPEAYQNRRVSAPMAGSRVRVPLMTSSSGVVTIAVPRRATMTPVRPAASSSTAATPNRVARMRSNAEGDPPRCT